MNILLCGCCGRMGRMVTELAAAQGETVVCGVDVAPSPMPYPVHDSLTKVHEKFDIIIDFSSAQGLNELLKFAEEHSVPVLLAATLRAFKTAQKKFPFSRRGICLSA